MRDKAQILQEIGFSRRLAPLEWRRFWQAAWTENAFVALGRATLRHPIATSLSVAGIIAAAHWQNTREGYDH